MSSSQQKKPKKDKKSDPTAVRNIKRQAKREKKALGISYHKALDLAARQAGFEHYYHAYRTICNRAKADAEAGLAATQHLNGVTLSVSEILYAVTHIPRFRVKARQVERQLADDPAQADDLTRKILSLARSGRQCPNLFGPDETLALALLLFTTPPAERAWSQARPYMQKKKRRPAN